MKKYQAKFGPFTGGLNTRVDASLIRPNEGQVVQDCDLDQGILTALNDVGASVSTNGSYPNGGWIWFGAGSAWLYSNYKQYACNDGNLTYYTQVGQAPQVYTPDGGFALGYTPCTNLSWTLTGSSGSSNTSAWAITYQAFDGTESNPQSMTLKFSFTNPLSANNKVQFSGFYSSDTRIASVRLWRAAVTNGVIGTYQLVTAVTNLKTTGNITNATNASPIVITSNGHKLNTGDQVYITGVGGNTNANGLWTVTFNDINSFKLNGSSGNGAYTSGGTFASCLYDDGSVTPTTNLTWNVGGVPSGTLYTGDHSPAPILTKISDRIHSVASGTGSAGSGILFGAIGNKLVWSTNGYPLYWPTLNYMPMDHDIEAIIGYTGFTTIFTSSGIFRIEGSNDDSLALTRLAASFFVKPGWGKSVVRTPYGTLFVSPDGLAVFDGSQSQLISVGKLSKTFFDGLTLNDACYYKDRYYLFYSTGYLIVNLIDGIGSAQFVTSTTVVNAACVTDFTVPVVATVKRSLGTAVRYPAVTSDNSSKIFQFVGSNFNALTGEGASGASYYMDTSLAGPQWTSIALLGTARIGARAVYVNGKCYLWGGQTDIQSGSPTDVLTAAVYTVSSNTWATDSTASNPTATSFCAMAADTTGGDTSGFWVFGGGRQADNTVYSSLLKYTISGPSWATVNPSSGSFTAVVGAAMVYVPASVFSPGDNQARLFIFGGFTSASAGYGTASTAVNTVQVYNLSTGAVTVDTTSATAAGWAARGYHVACFDATSNKIFLHGGTGADGSTLPDFWEFDPAAYINTSNAAGWVTSSGYVLNLGEMTYHGATMFGEDLYVVGGQNTTALWNTTVVSIPALSVESRYRSPGVYVLKNADGGKIRKIDAGTARQGIWQTGDFLGSDPANTKHAQKLRLDYSGDVLISSYNDNVGINSMVLASNATRTQSEIWLPFNNSAARGNRLSFQFNVGALSAISASTSNSLSVPILNGTVTMLSGQPYPNGAVGVNLVDLVIDSSGNIYVLDYGNLKVYKCDSNANYLSTIINSSTNFGGGVTLSDPRHLCIVGTKLYITIHGSGNPGAGYIVSYDLSNSAVANAARDDQWGLCTDGTYIYTYPYSNGALGGKYNTSLGLVSTIPNTNAPTSVNGMTCDPYGNLWVVGVNNGVYKLPSGTNSWVQAVSGARNWNDLEWTTENNLYAPYPGYMDKFTDGTTEVSRWTAVTDAPQGTFFQSSPMRLYFCGNTPNNVGYIT
jgi:hypothetical protein